jgi:hypothetical protein
LAYFYKKLGYAVWLVMLVMSVVFFKERAFFMDAGFQLFNMINEECIQIYHYRFITAVPQILPYFLLQLNTPLWVLALAFSTSYILFFLLIYHLLVQYLKNIELGWVLIFLFTLISLDTFYHIQSEFYLGLALLLLSFGIILYDPFVEKKWQLPIQIILFTTIAFSHKLTLIFFLFLWLFFLITKKELRHRKYILLLFIFLIITAIKSFYFTNWYEAAKQVEFQNNFKEHFPNFHTLPSNIIFLKRCLHDYYWLPITLTLVSIFYLINKKWLKITMVWAFTVGFVLLYNISDTKALFRFYSEVTYLPLSIFVTVPFLFDVFPYLSNKTKWLPTLFCITMALRMGSISMNSIVFKNNFSWIEKQLGNSEKMGTNRFLMTHENTPQDTVLMEWGVPFTAMHLSTLESPNAAKTLLIMTDFSWYMDKIEKDNLFFSPFHKAFENEDLNNRYYNLEPGKYVEIK